jgi:hypothetical protein
MSFVRHLALGLSLWCLSACAGAPPDAAATAEPAAEPATKSTAATFEATFSDAVSSNLAASRFEAGEAVQSWPTDGKKIAVFAWAASEAGCKRSFTLFLDGAPKERNTHTLSPQDDGARLLFVERCGETERSWTASAGSLRIDFVDTERFSFTVSNATMTPNGPSTVASDAFIANAVGTRIGYPTP